jgi:hypothetical protein
MKQIAAVMVVCFTNDEWYNDNDKTANGLYI